MDVFQKNFIYKIGCGLDLACQSYLVDPCPNKKMKIKNFI